MAATGKTPILLYGSTTATNVPVAGNLTNSSDGCEIAINVADKNLFFKDSTNAVNTVPIRQSSGSSDGWLSSTDWSTFNSKQPAGTYVTSVTGTAPVVSSGGTTPAISMAAATGSVNGYLTSTDWTTFNSKQAALVSGTNIKTVSGTTLLGSGDLGTIGTGYGGTGLTSFTANGVVYASSTSALTTGSGLTYTATGLGIGVSSAAAKLDVRGTSLFIDNSTASLYVKNNSGDSNGLKIYSDSAGLSHINAGYGTLVLESGGTEKARLVSTGNFTLASGNLVIGTSGKGIDFSATAGTGTSELLADYEEGTWTPKLYKNGVEITSPSSAFGRYVKIGTTVWIHLFFEKTSGTSATGSIWSIGNLPFTVAAINYESIQCGYAAINDVRVSEAWWQPQASATTAYLASGNNWATSDWTTGSVYFSATGTYLASS